MKRIWKRYGNAVWTCVSILAGNALLALAVAAFILPHGIITGGVTGIGILLNRFLPVDVAVFVLILNLMALVLGYVVLGKKFVLTTVGSSLLYPVLLGLIQQIPGIDAVTENTLLAALFSGGLVGIALGLVLRVGASTGGVDVVNLVLHKWLHVPVSVFVYLTDFLILGGQALFSNPEQILYGIVLLVLETLVLNRVMLLGQSQIQILAISSRYEEIRRRLLTELSAGVTMLLIETGYTGERQEGVLCVIPPRKLYDAKELIHSIDPEAFLTITQIKEVRGQGFTLDRRNVEGGNEN
ncbi:MAG: YitT family protein [Candidatus Avoscillospira sp.]